MVEEKKDDEELIEEKSQVEASQKEEDQGEEITGEEADAVDDADLEVEEMHTAEDALNIKKPSKISSLTVSDRGASKSSRRIELRGGGKRKRRSPKLLIALAIVLVVGAIFAVGYLLGAKRPSFLGYFARDNTSKKTSTKKSKPKPKKEEIKVDKGAVKIDVLNGNGTKGESSVVANSLKQAGWNVLNTANADNYSYAQTMLRYKAGFEDAARLVAQDISLFYPSIAEPVLGPDSKADIVLILGKDKKASSSVGIRILNGNGTKGSAQEVAEILKKNGFQVKETKNADKFGYAETVISYKPGQKNTAEAIAKQIKIKYSVNLKEDASLDIDIVILLGMK